MKDIENDKLMNELGDKLGRFREEPPEGMFERIEQTLLAGGLAGGEQSKAEAKEPEVVVVPLWRRPLFRGVVAAVAAASVCLAVIVTGGRNKLEQMTGVVGENDAQEMTSEQNRGTLAHDAESLAVEEVADNGVAVQEEEVAVVAAAGERLAVASSAPKSKSVATSTSTSATQVAVAQQSEEQSVITTSTQPESTSTTSTTATPKRKSSLLASATSSRSRSGANRRSEKEMEEYWRNVMGGSEEESTPSRPLQIGIHTANLGVNRGDVQMNNLSHSQLLVEEKSQLGGGSFQGPMMAQTKQEDKLKHWMPVTVGVTLSLPLTDWLSVESGLLYTSLTSRGESNGYMSNYRRERSMDYVGVPLALRLDVVDIDRFTLYGRLGVTGELCLSAEDNLYIDGSLSRVDDLKGFDKFTWSLDAAAGVNFALLDNLGLFGEVGCAYWKAPEEYPENYRTLHPLSLTTRLGLRYSFN